MRIYFIHLAFPGAVTLELVRFVLTALVILHLFAIQSLAQQSCSGINLSGKIMPPTDQVYGTCSTHTTAQLLAYETRSSINPYATVLGISKYFEQHTAQKFMIATQGPKSALHAQSIIFHVMDDATKRIGFTPCTQSILSSGSKLRAPFSLMLFLADATPVSKSLLSIYKELQTMPATINRDTIEQRVFQMLPSLEIPFKSDLGVVQNFITEKARIARLKTWCVKTLGLPEALYPKHCDQFAEHMDNWLNAYLQDYDLGLDVFFDRRATASHVADAIAHDFDLPGIQSSTLLRQGLTFRDWANTPFSDLKPVIRAQFGLKQHAQFCKKLAPLDGSLLPSAPLAKSNPKGSAKYSGYKNVLSLIDNYLNAGKPVYLGYIPQGTLYPLKTGQSGHHASVIYGRAAFNGKCGYLVRNSWGSGWTPSPKAPFARAVKGYKGDFWLSADAFKSVNGNNTSYLAHSAIAIAGMSVRSNQSNFIPSLIGESYDSYDSGSAIQPTPITNGGPLEY